jgi:hypothetical protein
MKKLRYYLPYIIEIFKSFLFHFLTSHLNSQVNVYEENLRISNNKISSLSEISTNLQNSMYNVNQQNECLNSKLLQLENE